VFISLSFCLYVRCVNGLLSQWFVASVHASMVFLLCWWLHLFLTLNNTINPNHIICINDFVVLMVAFVFLVLNNTVWLRCHVFILIINYSYVTIHWCMLLCLLCVCCSVCCVCCIYCINPIALQSPSLICHKWAK